jgi:hypothetical protein
MGRMPKLVGARKRQAVIPWRGIGAKLRWWSRAKRESAQRWSPGCSTRLGGRHGLRHAFLGLELRCARLARVQNRRADVKECARRLFAGCSFVRLRFAIPSIAAQASDPVGLLPRDRKEPEDSWIASPGSTAGSHEDRGSTQTQFALVANAGRRGRNHRLHVGLRTASVLMSV